MYRVNLLRFAYKKGHSIHKQKSYKKILNDLDKRLKFRYKIKININLIFCFILIKTYINNSDLL